MIITSDQFIQCCPSAKNVDELVAAMNEILPQCGITEPNQVSAFISQCGHESMDFTRFEENMNYSAVGLIKTWPRRFTKDIALSYARQPQKIANKVYANRMGNGDELSGDGWKYHGRGAIQLTGHDMYASFASDFDRSIDELPEYFITPRGAIDSAAWYWIKNNLNIYADDVVTLTKKINGGLIGIEDRTLRYKKCLDILGKII